MVATIDGTTMAPGIKCVRMSPATSAARHSRRGEAFFHDAARLLFGRGVTVEIDQTAPLQHFDRRVLVHALVVVRVCILVEGCARRDERVRLHRRTAGIGEIEVFADPVLFPDVVGVAVRRRRSVCRERDRDSSGPVSETELQAVERILDVVPHRRTERHRLVKLANVRVAAHGRVERRLVEVRPPLDQLCAARDALGAGGAAGSQRDRRRGQKGGPIHAPHSLTLLTKVISSPTPRPLPVRPAL